MAPDLTPDTLETVRDALGMSRADLARASGVHETTILRIEKGKDPRTTSTWLPIVRAIAVASERRVEVERAA